MSCAVGKTDDREDGAVVLDAGGVIRPQLPTVPFWSHRTAWSFLATMNRAELIAEIRRVQEEEESLLSQIKANDDRHRQDVAEIERVHGLALEELGKTHSHVIGQLVQELSRLQAGMFASSQIKQEVPMKPPPAERPRQPGATISRTDPHGPRGGSTSTSRAREQESLQTPYMSTADSQQPFRGDGPHRHGHRHGHHHHHHHPQTSEFGASQSTQSSRPVIPIPVTAVPVDPLRVHVPDDRKALSDEAFKTLLSQVRAVNLFDNSELRDDDGQVLLSSDPVWAKWVKIRATTIGDIFAAEGAVKWSDLQARFGNKNPLLQKEVTAICQAIPKPYRRVLWDAEGDRLK